MNFKQLLAVIAALVSMFTLGYIAGKEGSKRPDYEYQFYLGNYSTEVWQNGRYVGEIPIDTTSAFDKLMIKDNE